MTSIEIKPKRGKCHNCEKLTPWKKLATFNWENGIIVYYSPFICLTCHNKENFIEWKKVINNKGNEGMIYTCHCPKCEKTAKK